jgi:ankyrin repeat protein
VEVEKFLVKNLVNVNDTRDFGIMLLRYAAKQGCLEAVQFLIEEKVDINSTNGSLNNRTVLHYAAEQGNLEIVKFLLQSGTNPNAKEFRGKTPRDLAKGRVIVMSLNNESSNKPYKEIIDLLATAEKQYKPEQ